MAGSKSSLFSGLRSGRAGPMTRVACRMRNPSRSGLRSSDGVAVAACADRPRRARMVSAAWRPSATALIRVDAPRTASPPANTFGSDVWLVWGSALSVIASGRKPAFTRCPMDTMSVSASSVKASSVGTGRGRPPSGSGTSRIRRQRRPETRPPSARTSSGAHSSTMRTPSSSAASISSMSAGISLRVRR